MSRGGEALFEGMPIRGAAHGRGTPPSPAAAAATELMLLNESICVIIDMLLHKARNKKIRVVVPFLHPQLERQPRLAKGIRDTASASASGRN